MSKKNIELITTSNKDIKNNVKLKDFVADDLFYIETHLYKMEDVDEYLKGICFGFIFNIFFVIYFIYNSKKRTNNDREIGKLHGVFLYLFSFLIILVFCFISVMTKFYIKLVFLYKN